ncbi:MAG: response regulator transcription factor [Chloroflexota bacterium]
MNPRMGGDYPVPVIVAMHHRIHRETYKMILNDGRVIDVVALATIDGFLQSVERHRPRVVLLEESETTNLLIRAAIKMVSSLGILVFGNLPKVETVRSAIDAGARGYYSKNVTLTMLSGALMMIDRGTYQFSPDIEGMLLRESIINESDGGSVFDVLTEREGEILELMTKGFHNPQIAHQLSIAEGTVKNHVTNILAKLEVEDRTQAVILALRGDLGSGAEA